MKFELTESNKQFSNAELIRDLLRVSELLNSKTVSLNEYKRLGNYSYQTLKKRFGSWEKVLIEAGLSESKRPWGAELSETCIQEVELIDDMKLVAKSIRNQALTLADYDVFGKFGSATICKRFGGWNKAKEKAGLNVTRRYGQTDEEYFENIFSVWQNLGRQPKYQEMVAPLSKISISSYERKFSTWRNALEGFIEYITNKEQSDISPTLSSSAVAESESLLLDEIQKERVQKVKRTNRTANLRQRFRVMKRDGFKCILCGASPASSAGCELHIDHIISWSNGGETIEENLRTLCSNCNLGRSNVE
jgi:Homing endonuclease associated repeat/HNH endonuclease